MQNALAMLETVHTEAITPVIPKTNPELTDLIKSVVSAYA
jgi:hypothetical protein